MTSQFHASSVYVLQRHSLSLGPWCMPGL
uniref:Uncharacterized protein n=1 Tax=Arundo donax TaxID=35708 RepID=A0A0A9C7H5_ARUDO